MSDWFFLLTYDYNALYLLMCGVCIVKKTTYNLMFYIYWCVVCGCKKHIICNCWYELDICCHGSSCLISHLYHILISNVTWHAAALKTQYLNFRFYANYFLLPWKIPEAIRRRSLLFKAVSTISNIMYTQQKSSWTLIKIQLYKASIQVMEIRWMSSSFG